MILPPDHPPVARPRVGVLLTNLGTPDDPSTRAVRRYLAEFLSDRRVVELPPVLWQPILRGIILNTRPAKSAKLYQSIWDRELDDSPLRALTRMQADGLQAAVGPGVLVGWAMRYGQPAIADELLRLKTAGCERILLAPMYPQYCAATTATANDKAFAALAQFRWQPAIRTMPPYHDDPAYIDVVARSVEAGLAGLDFVPDLLISSFHGMPRATLDKGDPYHCQCAKTARLLAERVGREVRLTFQSRFGAAEWLKPYTDKVLEALPGEGVKRVVLVAPGFSVDCLETLEELAIRGREQFEGAGGEHYAYLPCLNATPPGIAFLKHLIARELAGWTELPQ